MGDERTKRLRRLLNPRSVAFIGGDIAGMSIRRSLEIGFDGDIWPIHPKREEIEGYRCYRSLDELPGVPDAAYIAINRDLTIDAVKSLSASGAGGAVCYAAGYAEVGGVGIERQQELADAAGEMPLIGPNCFGMINYVDHCSLWPYLFGGKPASHGVALISQSGNMAMNLTMNLRSVNFTHVIAGGNQAVLGPADYIDVLLEDDRVRAIGMYIEGFDDVGKFARSAKKAFEKGVPILILKVGRTEASAKQSASHTSSLAGSDTLYDALFARLGVIRVDSLARLLETLKILDLGPELKGRNVITLSCSGGEAATIADIAPEARLDMAPFSDDQQTDLESQFPAWVTVSNPFDYNTSIWGDQPALERCFTASMRGSHDAAFLVFDYPTVDSPENEEWIQALDAFAAAHRTTGMPAFVICTISELLPEWLRDHALERGIVPLQGLDDGLHAYSAAARYFELRLEPGRELVLPQRFDGGGPHSAASVSEYDSKRALEAFGLRVPRSETGTRETIGDIADRLGFPVVLKAAGAGFEHKTEIGAVRLNIQSPAELDEAAKQIAASANEHDLDVTAFLVEEMLPAPVAEVIVGIKRDEQFGPALVVGSGGVLVELVADSKSLLLPVTRNDIAAALDSLAVARMIRGYRGDEGGDFAAVVDAIQSVASYAEAHWESIVELDVNPLMVLPGDGGAIAADALIVRTD